MSKNSSSLKSLLDEDLEKILVDSVKTENWSEIVNIAYLIKKRTIWMLSRYIQPIIHYECNAKIILSSHTSCVGGMTKILLMV